MNAPEKISKIDNDNRIIVIMITIRKRQYLKHQVMSKGIYVCEISNSTAHIKWVCSTYTFFKLSEDFEKPENLCSIVKPIMKIKYFAFKHCTPNNKIKA